MRCSTLLLLCGALGALSTLEAQTQASARPRPVCYRGQPAAVCRAFWLTEAAFHKRMAGTGFVEEYPERSFPREHLRSHVSWEIGGMMNRGPATAVGATVLLGVDELGAPGRIGVKGRYRRWLDDRGGTLDFSGGLLRAQASGPYPAVQSNAYGATGDISVGWGDWVAVSVRADLLRAGDGRSVSAVYSGVRLGSYAAVTGTAVVAVAYAILLAAILGGGDF